MPGNYADFVRQVSTTTGTSDFALGAAVTGFRTFATAGVANLETVPYTAFGVDAGGNPSGEWESGIGTYSTTGPTLQRRRPLASSNSNAAVSFSAGTKHIILGLPTDVLARAWGLTGCRLSLDSNWCPTADITSSSTLKLLPGPGGGQVGVPLQPSGDLWGVGSVGSSGISLTLPTATQFSTARTCGITNGSVAVTHSSATAVPTGCLVTGTGIPTGTYVLASTTTTITLSRPATATNASASLSFYYSLYDVYVFINDYTTANRDGTTGLQTLKLVTENWTDNSTPPTKYLPGSGAPSTSLVQYGLYVGTIQYITTTTSRDTAAHRALYNAFNQLPRRLANSNAATAAYSYTTGAWRIANGDYSGQVEFVVGGPSGKNHGHGVIVTGRMGAYNSSGGIAGMGIMADLDSAPNNQAAAVVGQAVATAYNITPGVFDKTDHQGIGYHRYLLAEFGGTGTNFMGTDFGYGCIYGTILG